MLRYQNNAFRILGLNSNASTKEVLQRANEIKVKKSLSIDATYDYDFPWMGPVDRSEQSVINAQQRLENPIFRLKEEVFWFWIENDHDKKAVDALVDGHRQEAHGIWKQVIATDKPTSRSISAFYNQITLAHSSVIGNELILKYGNPASSESRVLVCPKCNLRASEEYKFCIHCGNKLIAEQATVQTKRKNIELEEAHWKNWRFVLSRFFLARNADAFWNSITDRANKINDPRLTKEKISEFKTDFLKDIASVNFSFMGSAMFSNDYDRARQHSNLLNGSSMPYQVLRDGFNKILSTRIDLLNKLCKNVADAVSKISEKDSLEHLLKIYSTFKSDITKVMDECNLIDINGISDLALARDNIAGAIRNISIKINNSFNAYDKANAILADAISYASSPYLKQSFEKDRAVLKSNLEVEKQKIEEDRSIQYQEDIGGDQLSIAKNRISFGRKSLNCDSITGIRYGIYVHTVNGIPMERSYCIWLSDNNEVIQIECNRGLFLSDKMQKRFNEVVGRLYKIVSIPLVMKMIGDFTDNKQLKIGKITIDHQGWHQDFSYDPISKGVLSIASQFLGTEDANKKEAKKQLMSWDEYAGYNFYQGEIIIFRKNENKKSTKWVSFNLREVWNAVNLGIFLDYLHKDGNLWSIIYKGKEKK